MTYQDILRTVPPISAIGLVVRNLKKRKKKPMFARLAAENIIGASLIREMANA